MNEGPKAWTARHARDPGVRRYYLGRPVTMLRTSGQPPGWVLARWEDGKVWRHWRDQLEATPWGK